MSEENSSKNREALNQIFNSLVERSRGEVSRIATGGRRRIDLRSLRKDRRRIYEKLGKEVEALVEAGEVSHPGLIRGVERLQELDREIESLQKSQGSDEE